MKIREFLESTITKLPAGPERDTTISRLARAYTARYVPTGCSDAPVRNMITWSPKSTAALIKPTGSQEHGTRVVCPNCGDLILLRTWWDHGCKRGLADAGEPLRQSFDTRNLRRWNQRKARTVPAEKLHTDPDPADHDMISVRWRGKEYTINMAALRRAALFDGTCDTVTGCCSGIEPDGTCRHGVPSWPRAAGIL